MIANTLFAYKVISISYPVVGGFVFSVIWVKLLAVNLWRFLKIIRVYFLIWLVK